MKQIEYYALAKSKGHTVIIHEGDLTPKGSEDWIYKFKRQEEGSVNLMIKTETQGIWTIADIKESDARAMLNKDLYVGVIVKGELEANLLKKP